MARGWESKAVEAQVEAAESERGTQSEDPLSPGQIELVRKKEGLLLSRSRVVHDLETANNPRYRKVLQQALAHLEHELAELGS